MSVKKCIFILFSVFFLVNVAFSQDPQFSQFYANKLYLAPSFAGATEHNRIILNHRNQWPSLPGVFLTYSFSFDKYFANFNSGVGFLVTHDRAGSGRLSNTNVGVLYSYDIQINREWHVRPGVNLMYTQRGLDFNKLIFSDQMSPGGTSGSSVLEVPPFDNAGDIDFSTSALLYSEKIWFGTTFDHLLRPEQSLYNEESKAPIKISVFGGVQVIRKGRLTKPIDESLSIAFLFKKTEHFSQMDLGLYWYKNPLIMGIWYRGIPILKDQIGDAIILLAGYKTKYLHIGYSYDFTVSNLITSTGGAHEISFVYNFKLTRKYKKKIHAIPCPEF